MRKEDDVGGRWSAYWRNLSNRPITFEPSMSGGHVAFLSSYFDHLFLL